MDLRSLGLLVSAVFLGVVIGFWSGFAAGQPDTEKDLAELNVKYSQLERRAEQTAQRADQEIATNIERREQLAYTEAMLAPYQNPDGSVERDPWKALVARMVEARGPYNERNDEIRRIDQWLRSRNEPDLSQRAPDDLFVTSESPTPAETERAAALHAALQRILEQD